jgi:uncharacterized protein (DUF983 family)
MTQPAQTYRSEGERNSLQALMRGFVGRCPHCGKGRMFRAFLKPNDACAVCGEELHHQRADDFPAYLVIVIVGHIIVSAVLSVETAFAPPYWVHAVIWTPVTLILAIALLQPIKGAIIGWQWAFRMHGFDHVHADPGLDGLPVPEAKSAKWTTSPSS